MNQNGLRNVDESVDFSQEIQTEPPGLGSSLTLSLGRDFNKLTDDE